MQRFMGGKAERRFARGVIAFPVSPCASAVTAALSSSGHTDVSFFFCFFPSVRSALKCPEGCITSARVGFYVLALSV